jgi:urea transporter
LSIDRLPAVMFSPRTFELAIFVGAASLAFWSMIRFPRFGPSGVWTSLGNIALAYAVGQAMLRVAPGFLLGVFPREGAGVALTLATLPPLTYLFITVAWFIRNAQRLSGAYR